MSESESTAVTVSHQSGTHLTHPARVPLASPLSPNPQPQTLRMLSPTGQPRTPSGTTPLLPPSPSLHSPKPATTKRSSSAIPSRPRERDFSYLLRPEIYHPLTNLTTPPAFRASPHQPTTNTPLPDLLAQGHFRAAAIASAHALVSTENPIPPTDHARIFDLLYTRLACLTLLDGGIALAAQEVKALGDLSSAFYYSSEGGGDAENPVHHLVPWDLRVLCVRLQALGFGDPRRAVMSYYDLAREARGRVAEAGARCDHGGLEVWKGRLGGGGGGRGGGGLLGGW
jgi:hypothetical protein